MPNARPLTDADRADLAAASPAWTLSADATAISRQFKGKNFTHAWRFGAQTPTCAIPETPRMAQDAMGDHWTGRGWLRRATMAHWPWGQVGEEHVYTM